MFFHPWKIFIGDITRLHTRHPRMASSIKRGFYPSGWSASVFAILLSLNGGRLFMCITKSADDDGPMKVTLCAGTYCDVGSIYAGKSAVIYCLKQPFRGVKVYTRFSCTTSISGAA